MPRTLPSALAIRPRVRRPPDGTSPPRGRSPAPNRRPPAIAPRLRECQAQPGSRAEKKNEARLAVPDRQHCLVARPGWRATIRRGRLNHSASSRGATSKPGPDRTKGGKPRRQGRQTWNGRHAAEHAAAMPSNASAAAADRDARRKAGRTTPARRPALREGDAAHWQSTLAGSRAIAFASPRIDQSLPQRAAGEQRQGRVERQDVMRQLGRHELEARSRPERAMRAGSARPGGRGDASPGRARRWNERARPEARNTSSV